VEEEEEDIRGSTNSQAREHEREREKCEEEECVAFVISNKKTPKK
jgi:hypothetical protein